MSSAGHHQMALAVPEFIEVECTLWRVAFGAHPLLPLCKGAG